MAIKSRGKKEESLPRTFFKMNIYYNIDEKNEFVLDTDSMEDDFDWKMNKLEEKIKELNKKRKAR